MSEALQIASLVVNAILVLVHSGVLHELRDIKTRLFDPKEGEIAKIDARFKALEKTA